MAEPGSGAPATEARSGSAGGVEPAGSALVFLARQPIFDRSLSVYGYELLYRSRAGGAFDGSDAVLASMQVLNNSLLGFGLDRLLAGKVGFINFPHDLLISELAFLLPAESVVIEILESVEPDHEVRSACRRLKEKGYRLALDDIGVDTPTLELAPFADFIKVDFRATTGAGRRRLVRRYGKAGVRMLAEKVETQSEFERARQEGFDNFQGYFFARPAILERKDIPAFKLNLLRLLAEIHRPEFDFGRIEEIIAHELSLCHRLLRYVNSAMFGLRKPVASVRGALVLLGEDEMRRWVSLAALPALAADKPAELAECSMLRARFCELMAPWAGLSAERSELFLMGMFSLLDAMLGRPMEECLEELGLTGQIREVLAGEAPASSRLSLVYQLVLACERADWEAASLTAHRLGIPSGVVSDLFVEAIQWCGQIPHAHNTREGSAAQLR